MTPDEYASPQLWPLTSQPGLDIESQLQLDSLNYDEWLTAKRNGEPHDERERAVGRELEAKHAARGAVLRQLQQAAAQPGWF